MDRARTDITVVICTRNRAESLHQTLQHLIQADKTGLTCAVVVVDNGGTDHTAEVARAAGQAMTVHYLVEPRPGKSHALNRALDDAPVGDIIAVLDDDMSPEPGWLVGVKAICERWPDHDLFTGSSHVIWPDQAVPKWCHHPLIRGWAFSVMGANDDSPLRAGRWFSGNHFWFRARVLAGGRRFDSRTTDLKTHINVSDPHFMLQLMEEGYGGVSGPDAVCGHRVQPNLLNFEVQLERARRCGQRNAEIRLSPFKSRIKQARLFRDHPLLSRLFCGASLLGWGIVLLASRLHPVPSMQLVLQLHANERLATYRGYLQVAGQVREYRLFGRGQKAAS